MISFPLLYQLFIFLESLLQTSNREHGTVTPLAHSMDSTNTEPPPNKVPRWALIICGLPSLIFMLTLVSMDAYVIATLQSAKDVSSLFKIKLSTGEVHYPTVFRPAFERAGYNLSDFSDIDRYSTDLHGYYHLQGNSYTACSYTYGGVAKCETPKSMEHSVFLDFPRQFLFNAVRSITDTNSNESIWLESPDDVVPLVPEIYMDELFESLREWHTDTYVVGIVFSIIGVAVVIFNLVRFVTEGGNVQHSIYPFNIACTFGGQLIKLLFMDLVLQDFAMEEPITSKANEFFSNDSSGLSFYGFWALYQGSEEGGLPFLVWTFIVPILVGGIFSFIVMEALPLKLADLDNTWKCKKEDKRKENEDEKLV